MGPFQLLDVVGNDVSLAIQKELFAEFKEPGFAPAASLEKVVATAPGSQDQARASTTIPDWPARTGAHGQNRRGEQL